MGSDRLIRHLLIAFAFAIAGYALFFTLDNQLRSRKGPWEVQFLSTTNGEPMIVVSQESLAISNVTVIFQGETNSATGSVRFDRPQKAVPFGRVKFEDLTYLPGSVTFDFFGHEVELLPRTLYLNKKEYPWASGTQHEVLPSDKLPPQPEPVRKRRR